MHRGKLDGSKQAGQVLQRFRLRLPASVLTGIDYIDEVPDLNEKEVKQLKDLLYQTEVDKFLEEAEEATKMGSVDWDIASKAAHIHYYRTYFEKENESEGTKASEWIIRALNMNPLHVDLTMKYAAILGTNEEYDAAAAILERLILWPDAPVLIKQWLGYYLRFLPYRLDESIQYSVEYHKLFPDESDTFFNISYAYGHKYCNELRASGKIEDLQSDNHLKAISNLRDGLRNQPKMAETVRKWIDSNTPLECLKNDKDFLSLVGLPNVPAGSK